MKKVILIVVLITLAVLYFLRGPIALIVMQRVVDQNMATQLVDDLPDGLHVVLCGAGSPMPDPKRSGPCTAVIAGNTVLVFDAGGGSSSNLGSIGIRQGEIAAIFITHFHSDHIDGLGELLMQRWVGGSHADPMTVYGPTGVNRVVAGFREAYGLDNNYRTDHHGEQIAPPSGGQTLAQEFVVPSEKTYSTVFDDHGVVVKTFAVEHDPITPAVGYRIEYGGRSVTISGDTAKSANLEWAAAGTDVLVHEALSTELVGILEHSAVQAGRPNIATIMHDILNYHTSPVDAARSASIAQAKHLLLTHIVPPLPIEALEVVFLDGVDEAYSGGVTLGKDGTMVALPRDTTTISVTERLF